ncbi:glutamate racemase [Edaphobacter sp.]|uniref:glutamate racemase n=1 Tax=Edaphobacter sp. TaxID=1934404 RepID=UPI002DB98C9F|nr:glutamate racemase [Edaphobacter sp.]HEU5341227.1 glutamate racemase [Edaphobacter sp.]
MPSDQLTIGVFDSGFGGLTVLRELLPLLPASRYIYLGDTARLPYGSKSRETIARYAVSSARYLHEQGADLLVVACNTATALALEDIEQALTIPVIGVIQPGAEAALHANHKNWVPHLCDGSIVAKVGEAPQASTESHVLVLATHATIQSHAYAHALHALGLDATEKACPLLVPLVEEGWTNHPVTDEVLKIYLTEALAEAPAARTLLLGCTHYPLLEPALRRVLTALGHPLTIIDSAHATARATARAVATHFPDLSPVAEPACTFYATDSIEKFQRLGSAFLGRPLAKVNLLDLGG